ncbi:MAG: class I SAM-dependent methyltransferase [archaeon]
MTKTRGLASVKRKIGDITLVIDNLLEKKKKICIMELGVGFGNAIMGLSKKYGKNKVQLIGVNKLKIHGIETKEDFVKHALSYRIIKKSDLKNMSVPRIIIGDAGKKIPLPNNSVDFIYSITTFFFIPNKAKAIEELYRVLKPEGKAIIHFKHYVPEFPKEYRNLFNIRKEKAKIRVVDYLKRFKVYGITLKKTKSRGTNILLIEKKKKSLDLKLKFIENESYILREKGFSHFATKSVFEVK